MSEQRPAEEPVAWAEEDEEYAERFAALSQPGVPVLVTEGSYAGCHGVTTGYYAAGITVDLGDGAPDRLFDPCELAEVVA